MLACDRKIRDNTPEIRPAGKLIPRGHGAAECMVMGGGGRKTPEMIKRIRGPLRPEAGQMWDISCRTGDPPVDPDISHGIKTVSSLKAKNLVNPLPKTKFNQTHLDLQEAHYNSRRNLRLGKPPDSTLCLPKGTDPVRTTFGKPIERGMSIDDLLNPKKTPQQVEEESNQGKELYKKSHNEWEVGEMVDRNYDWSKFTKDSLYGMETPHDNSGVLVGSALDWTKNTETVQVISKRLDDFREKTQHQLATVHDPLVDTLDVPPDHTFGITVPVDRYGAGALVSSEAPSTYAECEAFDDGTLMSVRNYLKKEKFNKFDPFLAALEHKDTDKTGVVPADIIHEIAFQFGLPLTFDMLDMLIRWCTRDPPGGVAYQDLVSLMNWNEPPCEEVLSRSAECEPVTREKEKTPGPGSGTPNKLGVSREFDYLTSSQLHSGNLREIPTREYRAYGVPTIRNDLPAPRIKRVSDSKNYGDEADSGGLIWPSVYSNHGVYERDFFKPYPPEVIRQIFRNIGVEMSDEVFQELWEAAAQRHPKGEVCVEVFRSIAEELHAEILKEHQLQAAAEQDS